MALFQFGQKKADEKKAPACCCGAETNKAESSDCCCGSGQNSEVSSSCCGKEVSGICCIKVLGAGCKSCHEQYENAKQAVKEMGLSVEVEYITDMQKVMEYGVMRMPAVVVNDKVVSMGKVLKAADLVALLNKIGG